MGKYQKPEEEAASVLTYLRKYREDRGAMSKLRYALSSAQRHRAWQLLAPINGIGRPIYETVAGLYGYHPEEVHSGNFGETCRYLAEKYHSFEGRFLRLLYCDREELCERLRPIVLAAKSKEIPINYEKLFADMRCWGEDVKARWAQEYWKESTSTEGAIP